MPRSTLANHQRRSDSLGQRLLQYRIVLVDARVYLATVERPRHVPCLGHRKRYAFESRVVADNAELTARRRYRWRTLQEDGGLRLDVGESGNGGTTLVDAGRFGRDGYGEIGRGADDLREMKIV